MPRRSRSLLVAALLVIAVTAGCSSVLGGPGAAALTPASLVLDFTPNPVHVGIYTALARGYDRAAGVRLNVVAPSASTDAIKLLQTGSVDFAILDIHDLALAREHGIDLVGILPIVQRPLAAVIAQPRIHSPRQLSGQTVGVTGTPSDTAVLRSVVAGSGGNPGSVKTITIGFNAVSDLLAGRVAAATAFWNDEGVTLDRRQPGFHIFRVDAYGAPSYPELVLSTTAGELRRHAALTRAVVRTVVRGYDWALANPGGAQEALESQVTGLDPQLVNAELAGLLPAFVGTDGRFGEFDEGRLRAWARWERRFGIVSTVPDVATMFDTRFAPDG